MRKALVWFLLLALVAVACSAEESRSDPTLVATDLPQVATATPDSPQIATTTPETRQGIIRGMGPGSGMMARHHVSVPEPYAGLTNPVPPNEASLERGAELYTTLCATCHGDGGMGDGPAGANLDPPPAPVAHSSHMLGDDLLFWRISEGGAMAPFDSAMPAWKDSLDEEQRWDLVNYVRALGRGLVMPRRSAGGATFDPTTEQAERAEMLADGLEQGVITQAEADLFVEVHAAMDEQLAANELPLIGGMDRLRDALLVELVVKGAITQAQADAFNDIHQRLIDAGLME